MVGRRFAGDHRCMQVNTARVAGEAQAGRHARPVTGHAYLDAVLDQPGSVVAMAHRGGAGHPDLHGAENTLHAFEHAVALGYDYLETDVHATRDGVLVAFHDDALDRVTDTIGLLAELSAEQVSLARIRAEHPVPTMEELLEAFPGARFNIDLKSHAAADLLARLLERTRTEDRVCIGSFSQRRLDAFRSASRGRVATSASPAEVALFLASPSGRAARLLTRGRVAALQVPHRRGRLPVVTAALVRRAHAAGAHVHVWTVDEPAEMEELLDLGVDGLITDRTDVLKDVLTRRGQWRRSA
jgi:glycerophosphoryl diester phosphodiesterase